MQEVTYSQFKEKIASGSVKVLDVRESWEQPRIEGAFVILIPVGDIEASLHLIPKTEDLIVVCQHAIRSTAVIEFLQSNHNYTNLINLRGGLTPYE